MIKDYFRKASNVASYHIPTKTGLLVLAGALVLSAIIGVQHYNISRMRYLEKRVGDIERVEIMKEVIRQGPINRRRDNSGGVGI